MLRIGGWLGAVAYVVLFLVGCGGDENLRVAAVLSGANEVPPVATAATGTVEALLEGRRLELTGTFTGLESDLFAVEGSAAHLHQAPVGKSGPIAVNVAVTSVNRRSGTLRVVAELTDEQVTAFRDGGMYLDVHSAQDPQGELRVQLTEIQPPRFTFEATLTGAEEVPSVSTPATGVLSVEVVGRVLVVTGRFQNLQSDLLDISGSSAHVHQAPADANGPIVFNLKVDADSSLRAGKFEGATELTPTQKTAFDAGLFYANVHTVGNASGELRTQLVPEGGISQ
ncbi:MAG: CHRD domain-containing protein [Myxococcota bacterium]